MANDGDSVSVHYTGTLDDGTVFDSSREREPLRFVIGSGQVILGFDQAARRLEVGQSVTVRMEASDAYGEKNVELIFVVPLDEVPEPLSVGDKVELMNGAPAVVTTVTDEAVTVDANHPMAGQALTFEIELVSVH
jgi:FKBP-type peptidyl-prolyl cis-trans isomerase 2